MKREGRNTVKGMLMFLAISRQAAKAMFGRRNEESGGIENVNNGDNYLNLWCDLIRRKEN